MRGNFRPSAGFSVVEQSVFVFYALIWLSPLSPSLPGFRSSLARQYMHAMDAKKEETGSKETLGNTVGQF